MSVVLRSLMLVGCTITGALIAAMLKFDTNANLFPETTTPIIVLFGALAGLLLAIIAILIELFLKRLSLRHLAVIIVGLASGAIIAWLITKLAFLLPLYITNYIFAHHALFSAGTFALYILFVYIGIVVAVRSKDEFSIFIPYYKRNRDNMRPVVLDTSAIIDGRIVEIYKTGFMKNKIIVPEFVLHELQIVSDSQVPFTRSKGRRGLETLKKLQEAPNITVEVTNVDYHDIEEVDDKLMKLAKEIDVTILTTDFNLQQVARIQHIPCINVFGLVNALKNPFVPGEKMTVNIVKEGSEINQGVGFLNDGTMVVITNARPFIGKRAEVELTSMLQGASGRIFFADIVKDDKNFASISEEKKQHEYKEKEKKRS